MKTDVRLKALGESFQNAVHVDSVRVRPSMLKVLLQPLTKRIRDLMESDELSNSKHLRVVSCCTAVKPLNDRRDVTEDTGIHQSWKERGGEREKKKKRRVNGYSKEKSRVFLFFSFLFLRYVSLYEKKKKKEKAEKIFKSLN